MAQDNSETLQGIKGIIFDYGGTIDSRGVHWSWILWDGYRYASVNVTLEQFREAYVFAERELARNRHILPQDTFADLLRKKVAIEVGYLAQQGLMENDADTIKNIAGYCYNAARQCVDEAKPTLNALSQRFPMMLVSNFYGNIDAVLRDFGLRGYFKGIIESSVVGVRKPNPTLFRLGVDALELPARQVLVVGDSLRKDILPAQQLGCHTLWLKARGWTNDEDGITRPDVITSLSQIPALLRLPS